MGEVIINDNSLGRDSEKIKIYSLSDVKENVRYIGKTKKFLKERLKGHLKEASKSKNNSYKNNWINSLLKQNQTPIIETIEEVDEKNWQKSEIYWISQFKTWGFKLTNLTDGGDGVRSEEHQKEINEKIKYKLSLIENPAKRPEVRKKISEAMKGRVMSDEWKAKMSKNGKGKKMPDSMKEKTKQRMLGNIPWSKNQTKDTNSILKDKSDRLKERFATGELIPSFKGKTHSKVVKKKISISRVGKPTWSKKVKQTNLISNEIIYFNSANDANRFYFNKSSDYIASIIRVGKVFKDSKFEYINE